MPMPFKLEGRFEMNFQQLSAEAKLANVNFYGSITPKVMFISETTAMYTESLNVPSTDGAYLYIPKGEALSEQTKNFIYQFIHILNPEVVVTIGKAAATYFNPNIKIMKEGGLMIAPEFEPKHNKVVCHLLNPVYFKMVPRAKESKHLANLKFYLMHKYGYGV